LHRSGTATVSFRLSFEPREGLPRTEAVSVKLVRRR